MDFDDSGRNLIQNESICIKNPLDDLVFIKAEIDDEEIEVDAALNHQKEIDYDKIQCKSEVEVVIKHEDNETFEIEETINDVTYDEHDLKPNGTNHKTKKNLKKEDQLLTCYDLDGIDTARDDKGRWTCKKCGLKYVSKCRFVYHLKRRHGESIDFKYPCKECDLQFITAVGLQKHTLRKHSPEESPIRVKKVQNMTCKYCGSQYKTWQSLYLHMKMKHLLTKEENELFVCNFCNATYTKRNDLIIHIKHKHDVLPSVQSDDKSKVTWWKCSVGGKKACKFCNAVLSNGTVLRYHLKVKHFEEYERLKKEIDNVKEVDLLNCAICGLKYKNVHTLRFHIKTKHDGTNAGEFLNCEYCGMLFTEEGKLCYHLRKNHRKGSEIKKEKHKYETVSVDIDNNVEEIVNLDEKDVGIRQKIVEQRLKCDECGKIVKTIHSMKHHKKAKHTTVNESEMFFCTHCDYKSKFKQYLVKHLELKHFILDSSKAKTIFQCKFCAYKSIKKDHFTRHMEIHSDRTDKRFMCEFCDYRSNLQSSITVHRRIHTKEKPYSCSFGGCTYRCTQKISLNIHMSSHEKEKNMQQCDRCPYKTANKYLMNTHLKSHDNGGDGKFKQYKK